MTKGIQLGFKAFDAHELLCHFVATEAGLYAQRELRIALLDITFIPDQELPTELFQVSCGAALAGALQGNGQRVVFVATDRPMFWLYGGHGIKAVTDLKNKTVATFPTSAPPHHLANMILERAAIDTTKDITLAAARDDVARFGLLKTGDVQGAVISSAIPPSTLERAGFHRLCFFGERIRLPTTGLAVHASQLEQRREVVSWLVGCLREALSLVHNEPALVGRALRRYFDVPSDEIEETVALYADAFTANGRTTGAIAQAAVDSLSASLGTHTPMTWEQIYDFSL